MKDKKKERAGVQQTRSKRRAETKRLLKSKQEELNSQEAWLFLKNEENHEDYF